MLRRAIHAVLVAVAVAALGACSQQQLRQSTESSEVGSAQTAPSLNHHGSLGLGVVEVEFVPTTMEELALGPGGEGYDAIVVGVVQEHLQDLAYPTPTEWRDLATEGLPIGVDDPVMSFREFLVEAELVILNHGDIAAEGEL